MFNFSYLSLAAFGAALVVTLVLAAYLTPAHWWRQLNMRALSVVAIGTWSIGTALLWLAQGMSPAMASALAAPATLGVAPITAGAAQATAPASGVFKVRDDLNIRAGTGTAARRLAVAPAGTQLAATGARDGDWWQVRASVNGREVTGWVSSLWLRRADERAPAR